jgi:hypothetical protein
MHLNADGPVEVLALLSQPGTLQRIPPPWALHTPRLTALLWHPFLVQSIGALWHPYLSQAVLDGNFFCFCSNLEIVKEGSCACYYTGTIPVFMSHPRFWKQVHKSDQAFGTGEGGLVITKHLGKKNLSCHNENYCFTTLDPVGISKHWPTEAKYRGP